MDIRIEIGDALNALMMADHAVLGQRRIALSGAWIVRRDACECRAGRDNIGEVLGIYLRAGIIGIGGAGFPTHVKLKPPADNPVDTLLLNGAECEPYITADHRMMLEKTVEIIEGAKILLKILGIRECVVGIENNKPDAIKIMTNAANAATNNEFSIRVETLEVKYPQGAEKMLITALLDREVPSGALADTIGRRNLLVFTGILMVSKVSYYSFKDIDFQNRKFTIEHHHIDSTIMMFNRHNIKNFEIVTN